MAQPVWVLSVDLQTKTATFQSGMSEAAKSARGAFTDIKSGASEMGGHVSTNMFASRHAIMAVSEAFGDTMPRAITALLVHIGPLGAALEAAFPFAAIALGAVLLIEHFEKLKEAGIKLTEDQTRFYTAVQTAFNALDQKMLQAEIRSDELRNDHLGALHRQLQLIDMQSMDELVHSFGEIQKAADVVFKDLESHWYSQGIGAAGAKHALEDFQTKYDLLLKQGKDKEATDLLRGTRESAEKVLAAQQQIAKQGTADHSQIGQDVDMAAVTGHMQAQKTLREAGVSATQKEVTAQQTLVDALKSQETIEARVAALKNLDKGNATQTVNNDASARAAAAAKEAADHRAKLGELALQADKEQAQVGLTLQGSTIAQRLALDTAAADASYRIELQANAARLGALDKAGKDYNNQRQALLDKAVEIVAQHETAITVLQGKATMEQYRLDLAQMEESEREKIDATRTGSVERLAAIDASLKAEAALNLQNTQHYRELLTQRVQAEREVATEEAKQQESAGKLLADGVLRTGQLQLAAQQQAQALINSGRRVSIQAQMSQEMDAANREYALKLTAAALEIATLDKTGKDYDKKLTEMHNNRRQLIQAHENEITRIQTTAEMQRNSRILASEDQFRSAIASGLTQTLMGHQTFAAMMGSIGEQVASGMVQNAIKSMLANDMTKESDAASAARKAFNAGMHFPWPANLIMAPVLAAGAFASVMAFQGGTDGVPGTGSGDVVPAMLEPGEGVVPKGVMAGLSEVAKSGGFGRGPSVHAPMTYAPVIQAIDATGVKGMLRQHADEFHSHFQNTLRKLNK